MNASDGGEQGRRVQRALLAHLRQEFIAPATAIVGYTEILIEDAKRLALDAYLSDLERIRSAGHALHMLLQSVLAQEHADDTVIFDQSKLRHDLRTPINAIKGYGEMLVEDASAGSHDVLLADLDKLLSAADGMLKRIDALVDFRGDSAEGAGLKPHAGIGGVIEAVRAIRTVGSGPVGPNVHGRILIVDDEADIRELVAGILEDEVLDATDDNKLRVEAAVKVFYSYVASTSCSARLQPQFADVHARPGVVEGDAPAPSPRAGEEVHPDLEKECGGQR